MRATRCALCVSVLVSLASCESVSSSDIEEPLLMDLHVHLFGTGDAGSGCRLSSAITDGPLFKLLSAQLGVTGEPTFDEHYARVLVQQMRQSGLDRAVLLAHDAVYDAAGDFDQARTHVYVPNDYLFEITEKHSDLFIPCVSINPDRSDALEELERCIRKGSRIVKIHPPIQGVDVSDRKHAPFFRKCAEENVLVMVHTGHEHAAPVIDMDLADPRRLELALELGCTVVACHCGSGWEDEGPDFFANFVELTQRYEKLWGDTSIMGTASRVHSVRRLLSDKKVQERLLHGSDFPFPSFPLAFGTIVGLEEATRLQRDGNWLRRDLELKESLGFGNTSAHRISRVLKSLDIDVPRRPRKSSP